MTELADPRRRDHSHAAGKACTRLLGEPVTRIELPGGTTRQSVRVHLSDRSVIVTRRRKSPRAQLEVEVLRRLYGAGAPVPRVLGFDGTWLIQEDLGVRRLSTALANSEPSDGEQLLDSALFSLARVHRAARIAGLNRAVATIGSTPDWLRRLVETPARLGMRLGLPAPEVDLDQLGEQLGVGTPQFVKWDARPGNAVISESGVIAWFDWEHCGCRNPLDDLAWLVGDEYTPHWSAVEERLFERYVPAFADGADSGASRSYLAAFGTLHMSMRLALIVSKKGAGPWWDAAQCISQDKVGVTLEMARRTCARAGTWSLRSHLTAELGPWFEAIAGELVALP